MLLTLIFITNYRTEIPVFKSC